jgi:hypothetical protein
MLERCQESPLSFDGHCFCYRQRHRFVSQNQTEKQKLYKKGKEKKIRLPYRSTTGLVECSRFPFLFCCFPVRVDSALLYGLFARESFQRAHIK